MTLQLDAVTTTCHSTDVDVCVYNNEEVLSLTTIVRLSPSSAAVGI